MNGISFSIKVKFWIHKYYWVFSFCGFAALLVWMMISKTKADPAIVASIITGILSVSFFIQKQKLEELKLFTELFRNFNERYEKLNDGLIKLSEEAPENYEFIESKKNLLLDYFNLCAEEYFYVKRGFIPLEVWEAWTNGMGEYCKVPAIKDFWNEELEQGSYYGFSLKIKG